MTDERAVLCVPGDVDEFVDGVVALVERPELWLALGRNAREAVEEHYSWAGHVARLWRFMAGERRRASDEPICGARRGAVVRKPAPVAAPVPVHGRVDEGRGGGTSADCGRASRPAIAYKDEVQRQWDNDPAGSHYVKEAQPHTLRVVPGGRGVSLRRVRALDGRDDGVRTARRGGVARDRRRHGHRSGAVRAARRRSVTDLDLSVGPSGAREGKLQAARPSRARSSITTPNRCRSTTTLRRRVQQRRAASHAEHAARRAARFNACSSRAAGRS